MKATSILAIALSLLPGIALATKTVCTITVNSADEKEAMRKRLPPGQYSFVELVQKGRPDWLRSACTRGVQCDVVVVSGHFNAGDTFYSDRIDNPDHLSIDELERAACSDSCPGLFSRLKEVYLFGCESLNPDATKYSSSYGESGRERMRRIFSNVPSIYGFSGPAPVGPTAAMLLGKYFDSGGGASFGSGAADSRMLSIFSRNGMTRVGGAGSSQAAHRARVCRFFDERTTAASKLEFTHALLRDADIGDYLKRIEALLASVTPEQRASADFTRALEAVAADAATRSRFLGATRAAPSGERARMISVAAQLGWLDASQRRAEALALVSDMLRSRRTGFEEVDLACRLNADRSLDGQAATVKGAAPANVADSAVLACMGDAAARARTLHALLSTNESDARIAQAYLRHRPVEDGAELRPIARAVANMPGSPAKVRALDALARLRISDGEILQELTRSFANARTPSVQDAIAEVFLRSSHRPPDLAEVIRKHRLEPPGRGRIVDSLLANLKD
ncbi:MAG TPA: hypothetical protein VFV90_13805 [Usitatibacter sp.]|nr:hypothetical protein [Usitatibacter sp.]